MEAAQCRFHGLDSDNITSFGVNVSTEHLRIITEYLACKGLLNDTDPLRLLNLLNTTYNGDDVYNYLWQTFIEVRVIFWLQTVLPPLMVVFGIVGNILSFFTFAFRGKRRMKSTHVLLCTLSTTDTTVLVAGLFMSWLERMCGHVFIDSDIYLCALSKMVLFGSTVASSWIIVAITYERFVAVKKPLLAKTIVTMSWTRRVVIIIFLLAFGLNGHCFFTMRSQVDNTNPSQTTCVPNEQFEFFIVSIWPWIDAFVYSFLPALFVIVFNTAILLMIKRNRKLSVEMQNPRKRRHDGKLFLPRQSSFTSSNKITAMMLTVSTTFVLFTFPLTSFLLWQSNWQNDQEKKDVEDHLQKVLVRTISELLMYFQNSATFYQYCIISSDFRQEFSMLCKRRTNIVKDKLSLRRQSLVYSRRDTAQQGFQQRHKSVRSDTLARNSTSTLKLEK